MECTPFELETAPADGERLRRVAIDPVSRVEGHGKLTLLLDEDDLAADEPVGVHHCRVDGARHA